jgi:hypothetical protein
LVEYEHDLDLRVVASHIFPMEKKEGKIIEK